MAWSKLKTIIIILLAAVDLLLAGLALHLHEQTRQQHLAAQADLAALFAADDIAFEPATLPDENGLLLPCSTTRNADAEQTAAAALLGSVTETSFTVGTRTFTSDRGAAVFSADGSFTITPVDGAVPLSGTAARQAERWLRDMGLEAVLTDTEETEEMLRLTYTQTVEDQPVFACTVDFLFSSDALLSCSGRCFLGELQPYGIETNLSLSTLLLRFRNDVTGSGDLCSAITALDYGYRAPAAYGGSLSPVLRVRTNIGDYFVDLSTAALERAVV